MTDVVDPRRTSQDLIFFQFSDKYSVVFERSQLASRSRFFDAIDRDKSGTAVIKLPSHCGQHRVSRAYAEYLSTSRIRTVMLVDGKVEVRQLDSLLIPLYLLGEHVQDRRLQDDVIDALLVTVKESYSHGHPWLPSSQLLFSAYEHTPVGSPLRKLLVDVHIWAKTLGPKADRTHKVFLGELLAALVLKKANGDSGALYDAAAALINDDQPPQPEKALTPKLATENQSQVSSTIPAGVSCCDYHQHDAEAMCGNKKRKRERDEETERAAKR